MWSFGFVLLGLMIGLCGTLVLANLPTAVPANLEGARGDRGAPVEWQQRLAWMGLAFVPSGLLVAFTTFLTTDVAAAPFLWVAPLAIYLVTFIVVFRPSQPGQRWLELAQPVVVAVAIINQSELGRVHLLVDSGVGLVAFVVTCLVCHRRLYLRRPSAVQVTEFYLWMSLGGVLGGIFSAIVAPQIFSSPIEYPLLLALGLAWVLPSLMGRIGRIELAAIGISVVLGLALGFALASRWGGDPNSWGQSIRMWLVLAVAAAAITAVILPRLQIVLVALAALLVTAALGQSSDYTARSFFGVHRVVEHGPFRLLYHGTTLHGAQAIRTPDGQPIPWNEPPPAITYFHPLSTHALGLKLMRDAFQEKNRPPAVGIIGLGAGAMACHARRGENWKFFEIDPLVVKIAKNERLFNYLSNCAKDAEIVLGDARVTLAKQESGTFDYLLFDAFTSDAVPVHLLTVEAIQLYLEKLSPRGVLALHVSNLHLDLVPVVAANVNAIPGLSAVYVKNFGRNDYTALPTSVVLIARQAGVVLPVTQLLRPDPKMIIDVRHLASVGVAPWTDDFSNVASALIRNYRNARKSADDRDIEYFSAVIARFPEAAIPYGRRGVAYFAKRLYGAAIDDLTAMMSIGGPVPEAYKIRGAAHQFSGNDVAAIADLTAYLSKQHNDVVALRLRGIAYGNLGQRDKAIADLRRVLFLNPTNQQAQQLLGRLGGSQ
jgi:hypothetical protein